MFSSSLLRSMATLLSVLEKVGGKGFVCGPLCSCLSISCMTNKKKTKKTNPSTLHCCFCSVRLNLRAAKAPKHRRLGSKRSCRKEENRCLSSRLRSSDRACWHFPNCHQCKARSRFGTKTTGQEQAEGDEGVHTTQKRAQAQACVGEERQNLQFYSLMRGLMENLARQTRPKRPLY